MYVTLSKKVCSLCGVRLVSVLLDLRVIYIL